MGLEVGKGSRQELLMPRLKVEEVLPTRLVLQCQLPCDVLA